jgi:hypothetical protein
MEDTPMPKKRRNLWIRISAVGCQANAGAAAVVRMAMAADVSGGLQAVDKARGSARGQL